MAATACLRGETPREVPARVVSVDDYVKEQKQSVDEEDAASFKDVSHGWALLGLQQERDYSDVLQAYYDTVGAFYDPGQDDITILHRGDPLDGPGMIATLVHEFSHALQHAALDEEKVDQRSLTTDASLASHAPFEGDATRTTDHALMLDYHADPSGPNWQHVYQHWIDHERAVYRGESLRITLAGRYFVYAFGAAFTQSVASDSSSRYRQVVYDWMRQPPLTEQAIWAGPENAHRFDDKVRAAYDAFGDSGASPNSTAAMGSSVDAGVQQGADAGQFLGAGAELFDGGSAKDAGRTKTDGGAGDGGVSDDVQWVGPDLLVPELGGHQLLDADAVGSFVLEAYATQISRGLSRVGQADEDLEATARLLLADSLTVWKAEERTVVIYRLQFETEWAAKHWRSALDHVTPGVAPVRTHLNGEALVAVSSDDEPWLEDLAIDELHWRRRSPADVAQELYPSSDVGNAASRDSFHDGWKAKLRGGCPLRPSALLQGIAP